MRGALVALSCCIMALVIMSTALAKDANASEQNRIVRIGKQYIGTPYGHGKGKLSCSEFTRIVFGRATGVWMSTWPPDQRFYGWEPWHAHKGDLVYFKEYRGDGAVTHVGIKLPHGKILHSSSYFHEVTISYIKFIDGYKGARRIR